MKTKPSLDAIEAVYWLAFQDLHLGRTSNGFGPNPIALAEMQAYVDLVQFSSGEERRDFMRIIRTLDRHYLEQVQK